MYTVLSYLLWLTRVRYHDITEGFQTAIICCLQLRMRQLGTHIKPNRPSAATSTYIWNLDQYCTGCNRFKNKTDDNKKPESGYTSS